MVEEEVDYVRLVSTGSGVVQIHNFFIYSFKEKVTVVNHNCLIDLGVMSKGQGKE